MTQKKKLRPCYEKVPEHLEGQAGLGSEGVLTGECGWPGENNEDLEPDSAKQNLNTRPLIHSIILGIITAHGDQSKVLIRFNEAKKALFGEVIDPVNQDKIDDNLLCQVAVVYKQRFFENPDRRIDLTSVIKLVIKDLSRNDLIEIASSKASLIDRLARKFKEQKDDLIIGLDAELDPERGGMRNTARRILRDLESLGISINRKNLDPALSLPVKSAYYPVS